MPVLGQVCVVESDVTAGDHRDLEALVVLKPVEESLEGHGALLEDDLVVVGVSLGDAGDGTAHNRVKLLRLVLDDIVRLREHDLGEGQVRETVLELCDVSEALDVLEELVADDTGDHSGGRGDGRDDLAGNHLGLVAVTLGDSIVASTEVGGCVDEVDVEV